MAPSSSWLRKLKLESVPSTSNAGLQITIASFNILSESYLTPSSHPHLPPEYKSVTFHPHHRRKLLCQTITNLTKQFDVLCLQEVDATLWDEVVDCFARLGYEYVHTYRGTSKVTNNVESNSRSADNESRSDGCAIFYCSYKWECFAYETVQFDDLVEEHATATTSSSTDASLIESSSPSPHEIIESYNSHNTALVIALKCVIGPNFTHEMIIGNMHLYWKDQGHDDVKLCQAHYLMKRIDEFVTTRLGEQAERIPVVVCGDANSKPGSIVHQYFTKGHVDPRQVASWVGEDMKFKTLENDNDGSKEAAVDVTQDSTSVGDKHSADHEHSHHHHEHEHDHSHSHSHGPDSNRDDVSISGAVSTLSISHNSEPVIDESEKSSPVAKAEEEHHHDHHLDEDGNHSHEHEHEHSHGHALAQKPRKQMKFDEVIGWLKEERLSSPYPHHKSAYALEIDEIICHTAERISFTTISNDVVDVHDYVLFDPGMLEQKAYLAVPSSFNDLNEKGLKRGHLLPSDQWPSDHLAIGAAFRILSQRDKICACPDPQQALLNCGCFIKNTFTMFEMAELRKQSKLEHNVKKKEPASFLPFSS